MLFFVIDIATIVCCAIFGARVLASRPRLLSAQLIALISFNTICHIVLSRYDYGGWIAAPYRFDVGQWSAVMNFARNLTPGVFMVLCFTLFSDERRFPRWLLGLFVIETLLEVPAHWSFLQNAGGAVVALLIIPAILQTLFVGFALYWTVANWPADLVAGRRRARALVTFIIGLNMIGSSLFLRVLIPQNTPANYDAYLALSVTGLPILLVLLVFLKDDDLMAPLEPQATARPALASPILTAENSAALGRLVHLLEVDHIYRRPELSLGELANLVQLPEYRLRRLINEQLGYQNFNAFLHNYRIREACRQLRDPDMTRVPILTIALSTGYQSINTFNRAFRENMGMTPSAYRALDAASVPAPSRKISPQNA